MSPEKGQLDIQAATLKRDKTGSKVATINSMYNVTHGRKHHII